MSKYFYVRINFILIISKPQSLKYDTVQCNSAVLLVFIVVKLHSSCVFASLQWRHNGRDSASNHQLHDCLLNRLFRHRSKKTSKLRVTGLCVGNSPGTGEFTAQMTSNAGNVFFHLMTSSWHGDLILMQFRNHETGMCYLNIACKSGRWFHRYRWDFCHVVYLMKYKHRSCFIVFC